MKGYTYSKRRRPKSESFTTYRLRSAGEIGNLMEAYRHNSGNRKTTYPHRHLTRKITHAVGRYVMNQ